MRRLRYLKNIRHHAQHTSLDLNIEGHTLVSQPAFTHILQTFERFCGSSYCEIILVFVKFTVARLGFNKSYLWEHYGRKAKTGKWECPSAIPPTPLTHTHKKSVANMWLIFFRCPWNNPTNNQILSDNFDKFRVKFNKSSAIAQHKSTSWSFSTRASLHRWLLHGQPQ